MAVKIPGLMTLENNTGAAVADGDGDSLGAVTQGTRDSSLTYRAVAEATHRPHR